MKGSRNGRNLHREAPPGAFNGKYGKEVVL